MPGWTDLPAELRQKCIKNMSLMSRLSLRRCSRRDRADVERVPQTFSRVRLWEKKHKEFVIELYMGIDLDLKVIFQLEDGKLLVYRYSPSHPFKSDIIGFRDPSHVMDRFLKTMLRSNPKKIATTKIMELFEIGQTDLNIKLVKKQLKAKRIIHINEAIFKNEATFVMLSAISNLFDEPKFPESYRIMVDNTKKMVYEDTPPSFIIETINKEMKKHVTYFYNRGFGEHGNFLQELLSVLLAFNHRLEPRTWVSMSFPLLSREKAEEIIENVPGVVEKSNTSTIKRFYPFQNYLIRFNLTPCGFWVDAMTSTPQIPEKALKSPCGMGVVCEKHADPIDYFFFRRSEKRLVIENQVMAAKEEIRNQKWWKKYRNELVSLIFVLIGVLIFFMWK